MRFVYSGVATAAEQTHHQKSFKYIELQHNRLSADDGKMSQSGKLEMTCPKVPPSLVWSVLEHLDPQACRALLWKLLFCSNAWSPPPTIFPWNSLFLSSLPLVQTHTGPTWQSSLDLYLCLTLCCFCCSKLCSLYKHNVAFWNSIRSLFFIIIYSLAAAI